MGKKIVHRILHGTAEQEFCKASQQKINDFNYKAMKTAYAAAAAITFIQTVIACINGHLQGLVLFYLGYALFFCDMTLITFKFFGKRHRYVKILYHMFAAAIFGLAITVGTYFHPESPAVAFFVLLVIVPLIYIQPPIQSFFLLFFACMAFIITTFLLKTVPPAVVSCNLANTAGCFVLSMVCSACIHNRHINSLKMAYWYQRQAQTDRLTGLFNKDYSEQICRLYVEENRLSEPSTLLLIDLDDFKMVNDTLGHRQGDYVLKEVGAILQKVFNEDAIVGRIGGDEFLVLMKNSQDRAVIQQKAETVGTLIREIFAGVTTEILSCSIGITSNNPRLALGYDVMVSQADQSLYFAKKNGKGRFEFYAGWYESNQHKPIVLIMEEEEIGRAVLCSCLQADYQVIVARDSGEAMIYLRKYESSIKAVILDLTDQVVNCCDVISDIISGESCQGVAVILTTVCEKQAQSPLELFADGYIKKPYEFKAVNENVSSAIKRKELLGNQKVMTGEIH